jgi:hypothetical protein
MSNAARLQEERHEDPARAKAMEVDLRRAIGGIAARRCVRIDVDPYTAFGPVAFNPTLCALLRSKAHRTSQCNRVLLDTFPRALGKF